jgi:thiamine-phosphate pyrophosphorylase
VSPALPRLVVVTDRHMAEAAGHRLVDVVAAAVSAGPAESIGVLVREKELARSARAALAAELGEVVTSVGGVLLVSGDIDLAREVGAHGVHLAAADPWPEEPARRHRALVIGRSCHTIADLTDARAAGADYASLSPVFATRSKPGYGPALGVAGLAAGCRAVPDLPVLALGGIRPGRVAPCLAAGARAVAVMGEVMRSGDPPEVVRRLVDELDPSGVDQTRRSSDA